VSERVRAYAPGEEISIEVGFTQEGDAEIESVEAVFARAGSGEQIVLLGDARAEASEKGPATRYYAARLKGRVPLDVGECRRARLSAREQLDDDWDFADVGKLVLVIRVELAPRRLEVSVRLPVKLSVEPSAA
jgi:hypothetical protein